MVVKSLHNGAGAWMFLCVSFFLAVSPDIQSEAVRQFFSDVRKKKTHYLPGNVCNSFSIAVNLLTAFLTSFVGIFTKLDENYRLRVGFMLVFFYLSPDCHV